MHILVLPRRDLCTEYNRKLRIKILLVPGAEEVLDAVAVEGEYLREVGDAQLQHGFVKESWVRLHLHQLGYLLRCFAVVEALEDQQLAKAHFVNFQ